MSTELGAGAWSYVGDPRAISHDGHTFTGWISTTGNVWVAHIRPVLFSRGDRSTKGFTDLRTGIHALGGFSPPL